MAALSPVHRRGSGCASEGLTPVSAETSEHLRSPLKLGERGGIGAGEEHLAPEARERIVERGAAARIEVGRDFVEERERRDSRHLSDQACMGEREPDDQRLLLAGRGGGRRRLLWPVPDQKVGKMRPDEGAAGGGVADRLSRRLAR